MQEAAEELDIALLRVDRQSFTILGTTLVIVGNSVAVVFEHAKEDEQGADHHASAAFSRLTMDDNDRRLIILIPVFKSFTCVGCSVILLHLLQEQGCIHTESEDFLQIGHIVIQEGESTDGEWAH